MARLVFVCIGQVNGIVAYAPLDKEDEIAINGRDTLVCDIKGERSKRTTLQNRSIHKFCANVANDLNSAGYDMRRTLRQDIDIPWTMQSSKDHMWRPVQIAMYDKTSSTQLDTAEVSQVYDTVIRHLAKTTGVSTPFPSRYTQMYEQDKKSKDQKNGNG